MFQDRCEDRVFCRRVAVRCVVFFLASMSCFAQSALSQYLNLTPAQVVSIQQLNDTFYSSYYIPEQNRVNVVNSELSAIYASPPPDPNQLGQRYVELEAIRRDLAARRAALQQQVAALLTPAQVVAIQNLNTAVTLQPLVNDAQCAFLVNTVAIVSPFFTSSGIFSTLLSGDFSVGVNVLPYNPPAPTASFCGSTVFPIDVREYLMLTDAQISVIFSASASYSDYYARQQNSIADLELQIRDETAKPSPDPAALGVEYALLAAIGRDIQSHSAQLIQTARSVLTTQQATQLTTLQSAASLQPLLFTAESCNLLVLPIFNQGNSYLYASYCSLG